MSIKKKDNKWIVDIRPNGTAGKRVIKKFDTKGEATRFEAFVINKSTSEKEWNPSQKDNRRLNELIELWEIEHKPTISSGQHCHEVLLRSNEQLNNPIARTLNTQAISKWRNERLKIIKATTTNLEVTLMKGLFTWLQKRKYITYENPFKEISSIKTQEEERPFLNKEQVIKLKELIKSLENRDIATITRICIETGCRWSEAENLTKDNIKKDRIIFTNTKSKKKRTVPINDELAEELLKSTKYKLFEKCNIAARYQLNKHLDLPKGISTHILRHTFASHFIMGGGNLVTLQKILGHSKIEMTMRYAHLSPEHLEDAKKLNPLKQMETMW